MCVSMGTVSAVAQIGSMVAGTVGGIKGANAAQREAAIAAGDAIYQGTLTQEMNKLEAEQVKQQAQTEVDKIKAQAMAYRGTQTAQQAASGVIIGDGSTQDMLDKTTQLAESDVLATLYSGVNRAVALNTAGRLAMQQARNRASAYAREGESKANNYLLQAGTSLLSGATGLYDKYEKGYLEPLGIPKPTPKPKQ